MATITEDYCNFETAKLLKEKGFDEMTNMEYNKDGKLLSNCLCGYEGGKHICVRHHNLFPYPAPTQQMAMKWLREVYNIIIEPESVWNGKKWEYLLFIITPQNADSPYYEHEPYKSYEKCVESAIKYCLENLI